MAASGGQFFIRRGRRAVVGHQTVRRFFLGRLGLAPVELPDHRAPLPERETFRLLDRQAASDPVPDDPFEVYSAVAPGAFP